MMDATTVFRLPRRRNYLIDKSYQTRFMMKFLAVLCIGSAVSGYVMFMMLDQEVERAFYKTHIDLTSTGQILLPAMVKVNLTVLVLMLLCVALITLYLSHKIAGPLSRLGRSAERIAAGDLTERFYLRNNDELTGLAKTFDMMSAELKYRFNSLRQSAEEMDRAAENLLFQHASSHLAQVDGLDDFTLEKLKEFSERTDEFKRRLDWFKIDKSDTVQ